MIAKRDSVLWRVVLWVYDSLVTRRGVLSLGFHRARLGWDKHVRNVVSDHPGYTVSVADPLDPSHELLHAFPERKVWQLRDALVCSKTGRVYLSGHYVVDSSPWGYQKRVPVLRPLPIARQRIPGPVIFTRPKPWNYYHWLIEELPAILRAKEINPEAQVLIPKKTPRYVLESLQGYGITPLKVSARWLILDHLVLAARGEDTGWPHKQDLALLREKISILSGPPPATPLKLYVSRSNSRRGFSNELEVEAVVRDEGFTVVLLEKLPFGEQVNLFRYSSQVFALHGAGLANLVFCRTNEKLVEVAPSFMANPCFEILVKQMSLSHRRLLLPGKSRDNPQGFSTHQVRSLLSELAGGKFCL